MVRTLTQDMIDKCVLIPSIYGFHGFTAEASSLGFPVDKVPMYINAQIGNGMPFTLVEATETHFVYKQENGCAKLTVFND